MTSKEYEALVDSVIDDLKDKYAQFDEGWKMGYISGVLRLESYLVKDKKEDKE